MDYRLPELGEGVYEAELVSWAVKVGDTVKRGQTLMEVMTDKATMEVPANFTGTVTALNAEAGQLMKIGAAVLLYTDAAAGSDAGTRGRGDGETEANRTNGQTAAAASPRPRVPASDPAATSVQTPVKAAPSVRHLARELGIDLARVRGSGPGGRVLMEDLSAHASEGEKQQPAKERETPPEYGVPGTRIKLAGLRRKIAEHMFHAKQTIPDYSYVDECDVTELVRLRTELRETYAKAGIKLTYLAFIVKAVAAALKEVPLVNASLDDKAGEIVLHDDYHVGVATATPAGLLVPVVRDADRKDVGQIAREVERLAVGARAGKLHREELLGGTFTVTSVGNIGGLFSTPIINHPEVGILGIGKIVKRPVFDAAGAVRPADLVYLSFSFDHRVVDGAVGAAFGNAVIRRLTNPAVLLLPEKLS